MTYPAERDEELRKKMNQHDRAIAIDSSSLSIGGIRDKEHRRKMNQHDRAIAVDSSNLSKVNT